MAAATVLDAYLQSCPYSRTRLAIVQYVILEALACGTPLAATTVGGIPEQVEDGMTGVSSQRPEWQLRRPRELNNSFMTRN